MLAGIEGYRDLFGPMVLNSTYRRPRRNATARGRTNSRHMYGDAVDIDNPDKDNTEAAHTWDVMYTVGQNVSGATVLDSQQDPLCALRCLHIDWR
jgi:uncharacterized protein YcbK (DUF882 family)